MYLEDLGAKPRSNTIYESTADRFWGTVSCAIGLHVQTIIHHEGKRVWYCSICHKVLSIYGDFEIATPKYYIAPRYSKLP